MAVTNQPIFPQTPIITVGQLLSTAAATTTAYDGTTAVGTAQALLYTAGANGGRVDGIRITYTGTAGAAPSGTTTASVVRIFINNGSANTTATNNSFYTEVAVPSITMSNTSVNGVIDVPMNISLPAGYKIYATNSTAIGGTACAIAPTAITGDY